MEQTFHQIKTWSQVCTQKSIICMMYENIFGKTFEKARSARIGWKRTLPRELLIEARRKSRLFNILFRRFRWDASSLLINNIVSLKWYRIFLWVLLNELQKSTERLIYARFMSKHIDSPRFSFLIFYRGNKKFHI